MNTFLVHNVDNKYGIPINKVLRCRLTTGFWSSHINIGVVFIFDKFFQSLCAWWNLEFQLFDSIFLLKINSFYSNTAHIGHAGNSLHFIQCDWSTWVFNSAFSNSFSVLSLDKQVFITLIFHYSTKFVTQGINFIWIKQYFVIYGYVSDSIKSTLVTHKQRFTF